MLGDLGVIGAAFAFGVGSSILPMFLNAELYVISMAALISDRSLLLAALGSLVVGTTAGKAVVFYLAQEGTRKLAKAERKPPRNVFTAWVRRIGDWMLGLLNRPYLGAVTVFVSSLIGVPPLAVVSIVAGASKQPMWLFLVMVTVGRSIQYLAIAFFIQQLPWFH